MGVHRRTLLGWLRKGCPGAGSDGFDVAAIEAWRSEHVRSRPAADDDQEKEGRAYWSGRKERAAALSAELQLARERGELVEVGDVSRLFERHIHEHNSLATQLVDRVLQLLPPALKAADKKRVMAGVRKAVEDLRNGMADTAKEWEREAQELNDRDAESDE